MRQPASAPSALDRFTDGADMMDGVSMQYVAIIINTIVTRVARKRVDEVCRALYQGTLFILIFFYFRRKPKRPPSRLPRNSRRAARLRLRPQRRLTGTVAPPARRLLCWLIHLLKSRGRLGMSL